MKRLFLPLLLLVAAACETEVPPSDASRLVIDGWIDSGGAPVVMVTTTVAATPVQQHISTLRSHVIKTANVSVVCGRDTVQLVGQRDNRYTPPFVYTTDHMRGIPGKKYTLKVVHGNHVAWSETTIPEPEEVTAFSVERQSDSLASVLARWQGREGSYYKFFTRIEGADSVYCPSMMAVAQGKDAPLSVPVIRGWHLLTRYRQPLFPTGKTVHIKFCTMEEALYRYWCSYDDVSSLARNVIFPAKDNAEGNVQGAYGCWAGYGAYEYKVEIP